MESVLHDARRVAVSFDTWSEAFGYCREKGSPVIVLVENEVTKIYPSGRGELIYRVQR